MLCFGDVLGWFGSSYANNLGTFLSGIAFVGGWFSWLIWKKQKSMEMQSLIANDVLNCLDDFKNEISLLIEGAYFVNYAIKTEEKKESMKGVPVNIRSYIADYNATMQKLTRAKNLAMRLSNQELNEKMKDLYKTTKHLPSTLQKMNWPKEEDSKMLRDGIAQLQELPNDINDLYEQIQKKLSDIILYKKS